MLKLAEISGISWDEVLASARGKNATKGKFDGNWVMEDDS